MSQRRKELFDGVSLHHRMIDRCRATNDSLRRDVCVTAVTTEHRDMNRCELVINGPKPALVRCD